ncbi:hypothetical protein ANN_17682 [Periplaneta americana]|uniref:Uncharacterized protein n=1 Tax=Periplaneta americana TaxID=6978 RepID=A0ABQ8SV36_PERAM|nr:hypothetical protein ANN_17682 [Periplaneta americana]
MSAASASEAVHKRLIFLLCTEDNSDMMAAINTSDCGGRFSRQELFEVLLSNKNEKKCILYDFIISELGIDNNYSEDFFSKLKAKVESYYNNFNTRLKKCHRMKERFETKYGDWLSKEFEIPCYQISCPQDESNTSSSISVSSFGRPRKLFSESSIKSKRRKTEQLRKSGSTDELVFVTQVSLKSSGKTDAAKLIESAMSTPTRATKILTSYKKTSPESVKKYTSNEALALIIDTKLSKHQYSILRLGAKCRNADLYPTYNSVREAKLQCYPDKDCITITEVRAEISLQGLLDHTVKRIVRSIEMIPSHFFEQNNLTLFSKWGCDGSSGHNGFKQKLADGDSFTDSEIFLLSFVPLLLYSEKDDKTNILYWENPRPSSTKYCRPINIKLKHETSDLIKEEIDCINNQINNIQSTIVDFNNIAVEIKHELKMTMVDGKVCNTVVENKSAQVCYICGASPKHMNDIDSVQQRTVDHKSFSFGLSILHAWIRFLECLLHVAYRLDFKKWQARGKDNEIMKLRKESIQKSFRAKMGLIIDRPKPGGSGTSNDGNTARRFFANPELAATITGVDVDVSILMTMHLKLQSSLYRNTPDFTFLRVSTKC